MLINMYYWMSKHQFLLKTKFIAIGNYKDSTPNFVEININSISIERDYVMKYLRIIFDSKRDDHMFLCPQNEF